MRTVERLLAAVAVALGGLMVLLHQLTGSVTPCGAVAQRALPAVPHVASEVLDACIGAKGEGGLAGIVVELGLALTGNSRDKMQRRIAERLETELRSDLLQAGEARCTIILAEGLVGRANGGPASVVARMGDEHKFACRGDDKAGRGR